MSELSESDRLDPERLSWSVPCLDSEDDDAAGEVKVLVLGDRVALVLPPGETLVFTPDEAGEFAKLLGTSTGQ
ncbi:hypothetical protein SAMN04487819_104231 [Actinopolyspora alba]|uniref:DUF397 domain-containing protein n=1 Tax=Actinopolyspora alba TaxID=673379 RepID=A0A1I1VVL2_9ACTN|nr:hypothetical protein [Actinopolyspora alba]SFD86875.1 hypothetical protein SAMN04487819_104231 [Actinopolyspora alba]